MNSRHLLLAAATAAAIPTSAVVTASASAADGAVITSTSARQVGRAMTARPAQFRGASWAKRPVRGGFAALSTRRIGGFPTDGRTFGLLSSGRAAKITLPNYTQSLSTQNNGVPYRGTRDTVILKIDLQVPKTARCLSLQFRFLSEEYREYVGTQFNDAFIAELDRSTWTATGPGGKIRAPRNFATVGKDRYVSVNGAGAFAVTPRRAKGTTYDASTRRLRASAPITPGRHSVYLTIFDQGDQQFDSTVLIDRLIANGRKPCVSGAAIG